MRTRRPRRGRPPQTALDGINVLDLSSLYAGPLIGMTLADFGAEVVKVEHPRGDDARRWGLSKGGVPLWWKVIARSKKLIVLDLNTPGDRQVARRLCAWADVVIENFRPGRMEKWGLGYEELSRLNPRLIMVRVTGFGQSGPYRFQPGFGTLAEAFSGFAFITGQADGPPTLPPFGLADGVAALAGTYATLMALYWRDAQGSGRGQYIDLSLYEPLFSILGPQAIEFTQVGVKQVRHGNCSPRTAPRNTYPTADGQWVALSGGTQEIVNRILAAVGRPELRDDPRFSTPRARVAHVDELDEVVGGWIKTQPLKAVLARFAEVEAPIAPVYDIEQILEDPHYRARETVVRMPDPDLGEVVMQNVMPKLSATPGIIRHTGHTRPGADKDYVYQKILGLSPADARKEEEGI